ncbi:MAG: ATP-dependent sacrificial sulfur transferase LarE [Clostridia bacterium]|nr:ATP-dependent sacrificial sulfur transferase LarE [Clostridia bacterium]
MSENKLKLENKLHEIAKDNKIALAYSGGVDSSILKTVAELAGIDVLPLTFDLSESLKLKEVRTNDKERCYYCKSLMMSTFKRIAAEAGYEVLCDGTNADDRKQYRPGLRALEENGVISPIAEAGITKEELRAIGRELGLPVASKPSSPCLLTRFPYGTFVTDEMLDAVDNAERIVKEAGFEACRVRVYGALSKVEVPVEEIALAQKENLTEKLCEVLRSIGVEKVDFDPKGLRSGTMDEN